ncbi:amino acid permease [Bordetella genomosp. 9]|uniref:Amino acid permease n=1 Tax=Bordetella genomosp. 9 TaxID=1416803 RepID=A0A261RNE9_9BORD|nr:amino acid permease [Bordetella genomosp. 9]
MPPVRDASTQSSATPNASRAVGARPSPLLSTLDVMALVVGIVIGAGIFSAPALIAANAASLDHILIAWVVGGAISLAGAMCYAELATTYPDAGGDYHYLRRAFGERTAFLFAWARLTIIPTGSIALLGYVFGDYASQIYSLGPHSAAIYAAITVVALTILNIVGLNAGKWTQNFLTVLEVGGVLFIIGAGLLLDSAGGAGTVAPAGLPTATNWGLVLIFVMLTYGGWNEAAYVSAEVVGPGRNLPRALFWSLALVTVVYLLVNLAYAKVLGLAGVAASNAVAADALRAVMGENGARVISALIAISALTSANATVLTGARTTYAFGRDEPMFRLLGRWDTRHHTPTNALLVQGLIALALAALGAATRSGFATMVEYTAPVFWLFFVLTGMSLFILRRREPTRPRPFSVPFYPFTPLLFCGTSAYLLYASIMHTGVGAFTGLAVLALGALVLLFRRRPTTVPAE